MKIILIGPGILPIPPKGWGAIEILIADQAEMLKKLGYDVYIVNDANKEKAIDRINIIQGDIVHLHYDEHIDWVKEIDCKRIYITSHFGYLSSYSTNSILFKNSFIFIFIRVLTKLIPQKITYLFGIDTKKRNLIEYYYIFKKFLKTTAKVICLSKEIENTYKNYNSKAQLTVFHNGARVDLIRYSENAKYPEDAICIGKIEIRKKQSYLQNINNIKFVGPIVDKKFNKNNRNYMGTWTRDYLFQNLTNYSTLVLISNGEAHPLVCCEALIAGLGLVVSEEASSNLDKSLPYISVIKQKNIYKKDYIYQTIKENIKISELYRKEIRKYALATFDIERLMKEYPPIKSIN
mgnify:CR=1 FL=1